MYARRQVNQFHDMPDHMAEACLWANVRYPQMLTGMNLALGVTASASLLRRESDWSTLGNSRLTEGQANAFAEQALKMHDVYGISVNKFPAPLIARAMVEHAKVSLDMVERATANYAHAMLGKSKTLPDLSSFGAPVQQVIDRKVAVNDLYTFSRWRQKPRPEAVALDGVWRAAAITLNQPHARVISKAHRETQRKLIDPTLSRVAWESLSLERVEISDLLRLVISDNIEDSVQEITNTTGVSLELPVIQTFVNDIHPGIAKPKYYGPDPTQFHIDY